MYVQRVEIAQGHLSLLIQDVIGHRDKGDGSVNSRTRGRGANGQLDGWYRIYTNEELRKGKAPVSGDFVPSNCGLKNLCLHVTSIKV